MSSNSYNNTEIGPIPKEWEVKKIGDFAKEVKVKNKEAENYTVLSVTKYDGIVSSLEYFKKQVYSKDTTTYKVIKKDQFAYATIHLDEGSIGLLEDFDSGVISPMYTVFETNNTIDKNFLFLLMKSDLYVRRYSSLGQGSINRRMSIPFKALATLPIHFPPLNEQSKIVEIISSVKETIKKTEAIIKQTEKVKKGLMQQLLTKGIGHTEFKQTEIGEIPEEWEVKHLGEIAAQNEKYSFVGGPFGSDLKSEEYTENGVRIIQLQNIKDGSFSNDYKIYTSEEKADELLKCNIYPGDIIIAKMAEPVARACIIPNIAERFVMASDGIRLSVDKQLFSTKFIMYAINSPYFRQQAIDHSTGTTRLRIGLKTLRNLKVAIPPLQEQKEIESVLSTIEGKLKNEEMRNQNLIEIKKGLMQVLLTGKVRVKVDDE
ncbi:restriction endonuclease subunit S [Anaerobacillus alkalidiazotrophicus]|uniref:restriction endonuclease subunit S n=1 Tax=Anaerobacillus alkalidiazotrophicus TaxID=472963 RepID=UPI00147153E0|nr:restriction endonuclease subunit S [Anaerobacillus alkalidiazotrophicus]